ncbi:FRMD8 protein, partial [Polyodon spathula]|nr:FRMD8 protein [Polyodon spathula]
MTCYANKDPFNHNFSLSPHSLPPSLSLPLPLSLPPSLSLCLSDEPFLQFRRNVFFPKAKELLIEEEGVLRLLYEEAKGNILEGRYPCDPQDCESLGALSCRVELGRCEGEEHCAAVSSKLGSFLPPHLCRRAAGGLLSVLRGGRRVREGERLVQAYRSLSEHSGCSEEEQIKRHLQSYLSLCQSLPYYG